VELPTRSGSATFRARSPSQKYGCGSVYQYALNLVLKGAATELITNTSTPASQKGKLAKIIGVMLLYKSADKHLPRKIADAATEHLLV